MRKLGWVDGENMVVERRYGESVDELRAGAADRVRQKVDVLFVTSGSLAKIVQLETQTVPVGSRAPAVISLPQDSSAASQSRMASPFMAWHSEEIVNFAARHRIVAVYEFRQFVDDGGLMSYGANFDEIFRRGAVYVDKILRGVKPGDLPIEQPTKLKLVINLKTANTLGLTIPQWLRVQAELIE